MEPNTMVWHFFYFGKEGRYKRCFLTRYFFGGLECVGHSFAYVAHLWFLRDVWIRTQSDVHHQSYVGFKKSNKESRIQSENHGYNRKISGTYLLVISPHQMLKPKVMKSAAIRVILEKSWPFIWYLPTKAERITENEWDGAGTYFSQNL